MTRAHRDCGTCSEAQAKNLASGGDKRQVSPEYGAAPQALRYTLHYDILFGRFSRG